MRTLLLYYGFQSIFEQERKTEIEPKIELERNLERNNLKSEIEELKVKLETEQKERREQVEKIK